jgi:hypothetical protein
VIVIALVALCATGIVVMLLARLRTIGQSEQCKNNLRRIGEATYAYHSASAVEEALQRLPPSRIADGYATWGVLLAPYLTKEHPLHKWDQQLSYFAQAADVREARMIYYFCPARLRPDTLSQAGDVDAEGRHFAGALGDYGSVAGDSDEHWTDEKADGPLIIGEVLQRDKDRILKWRSRTSLSMLKRGMKYTLLVGEKHVPPDHMMDAEFGDGSVYNGKNPASFSRIVGPNFPLAEVDAPFNRNFGSYHNGVSHFLYAEGNVGTFKTGASAEVLGQQARRD